MIILTIGTTSSKLCSTSTSPMDLTKTKWILPMSGMIPLPRWRRSPSLRLLMPSPHSSTTELLVLDLYWSMRNNNYIGLLYGLKWRWNQGGKQAFLISCLDIWPSQDIGHKSKPIWDISRLHSWITRNAQQSHVSSSLIPVLQEGSRCRNEATSYCQNCNASIRILQKSFWAELD